jgi:hypothetical protein
VTPPAAPAWHVAPVGEELRLADGPRGRPGHVPQVAVLPRRDGFLRLAPEGTTWGADLISDRTPGTRRAAGRELTETLAPVNLTVRAGDVRPGAKGDQGGARRRWRSDLTAGRI